MTALARDPAQLRREGLAAMASGRWPAALACFREYLAIQPSDGRAWTNLAACCEKVKDRAGRLDALRGAAEVYERDRLLPQAAAAWTKVAQLTPADGWPAMKLGDLYRALDRRADARAHYTRAESIYREAGRAFEATQARRRGDDLDGPVAAAADKQSAEETSGVYPSDDTEAFVADRKEEARLMRRYGLFDRAISSLEEVLARFPDERDCRRLLVETLRDARQHERADTMQVELDAASTVSGRIVPSPERHIPASERSPEVDTDPGPPPLLPPEEEGIEVSDEELGGHLIPDGDGEQESRGSSQSESSELRGSAWLDSPILGEDPEWTALLEQTEREPGLECNARGEVASLGELLDRPEPVGVSGGERAVEAFVSPVDPSGRALTREVRGQLARATADADDQTRLDLATAFISMGLEDEAVAELQEVAKGTELCFEAAVEIGESFMRRSLPTAAVRWYERALSVPGRSFEGDRRVRYRLGVACEDSGEIDRAFGYFLDLYAEDARFEDVAARVHRLRPLLRS